MSWTKMLRMSEVRRLLPPSSLNSLPYHLMQRLWCFEAVTWPLRYLRDRQLLAHLEDWNAEARYSLSVGRATWQITGNLTGINEARANHDGQLTLTLERYFPAYTSCSR